MASIIINFMETHNLNEHDYFKILQYLKYKIDKKMICCDQCNILTTDFIRSCDGYDIFLENLCKNCAVKCDCGLWYGESGYYKHINCNSDEEM
jgi:hypothetical protein